MSAALITDLSSIEAYDLVEALLEPIVLPVHDSTLTITVYYSDSYFVSQVIRIILTKDEMAYRLFVTTLNGTQVDNTIVGKKELQAYFKKGTITNIKVHYPSSLLVSPLIDSTTIYEQVYGTPNQTYISIETKEIYSSIEDRETLIYRGPNNLNTGGMVEKWFILQSSIGPLPITTEYYLRSVKVEPAVYREYLQQLLNAIPILLPELNNLITEYH